MWALYKKEIYSFLSSLVGFIVMATFLVLTGLFVWIFPGELNLLDSGYADLQPFFTIAPWIFLFLIPAITMKFFAEEKRTGTIETLLTQPITERQIVLAKYLAGQTLVIVALLPTLVYYSTISNLGSPVGNIDGGGVAGSYIGLILLSSAFVAIGTFASSLTSNQIIAFILSVFLSFFLFTGFDSLGSFEMFGSWDHVIRNIGIIEHYKALSRGVIDSRDVIYLLSLTALFFLLTKVSLESRKW